MTAELDLHQAEKWIDFLHGNSPGLISVVSTLNWTGQAFNWETQRETALRYIQKLDTDGAEGIYLRVTTLKAPLPDGKRGSDTDCLALGGLWADMDLAGPGHRTTETLPPDFSAASRIVAEAGLPEPTLWIHSGGGLYPWWLLDQPAMLLDPQARGQAQQLSTTWQQALAAAAKRLGLHYGSGVGDLPRVLRIPGTVNRKIPDDPRPCRFLYEEGHLFSLDDLSGIAAQVAPEPEQVTYSPSTPRSADSGLLPGDDFDNRAQWDDQLLLGGIGARVAKYSGTTTYWLRDGASRGTRWSGTTGHAADKDRFYSFSTEWHPFEAGRPYTKFQFYTALHHGGDFTAAARDLARQGYGDQIRPSVPGHPRWEDWGAGLPDTPSNVDSPVVKVSAGLPRSPRGRQDYTISGAANRFVAEQGRYFWYVTEEKCWRVWNGVNWERDDIGSKVSLAFEAMTEDMMDEADQMLADAQTDPDKLPMAKAYNRHVNSIRNAVRKNIVNLISQHRSIAASAFDADTRYLNLRNGVYDLTDDVFLDHHPKYMLTKVSGVDYDPDAKAPRTEAFFDELLPSEPMREFVLQGLGYSLTGEADRKAMFILQGQSNSGKTQLTELVQGVFGDYAVSVSPGTFAKRHDSSGPNPELHDIRSARFVYSSETSHDLALDEELVKRVTGKDTMSTRTLYEKSQRWIPQCVVWVATNNLPRFGSDSEAIWRRVKTVRFVNEFTEDGSSGHVAQPNIGRNLAQAEASGVFNLLLEALRRYRAAGRLVEPSELKESVATHRQETDPVAQWVAHVRDKGQLVARPGGRTDQKVLRKAYETWCADEGFRPLAANRFGVALAQNLDYERLRSNGDTWVVGWHWTGSSWAVGQAIFGDWRDRE